MWCLGTDISATANKLVGLYGGTFNPPHLGHLHVAQTVIEQLGLSRIHWVLAARPSHRHEPQVSATQRLALLQQMLAAYPEFVPDDTECNAEGPSYTYNTLVQFHREHPEEVACWIMGFDAYVTLPSWYRWRELPELCNLVVVQRPGETGNMPPEVKQLQDEFRVANLVPDRVGQIVCLEAAMLDVSSTEIRNRAAHGKPIEHLLASPVSTYIKQHNLYLEKSI